MKKTLLLLATIALGHFSIAGMTPPEKDYKKRADIQIQFFAKRVPGLKNAQKDQIRNIFIKQYQEGSQTVDVYDEKVMNVLTKEQREIYKTSRAQKNGDQSQPKKDADDQKLKEIAEKKVAIFEKKLIDKPLKEGQKKLLTNIIIKQLKENGEKGVKLNDEKLKQVLNKEQREIFYNKK